MKYDCIATFGCSFMHGAQIFDENRKWVGKKNTASRFLADYFKIPEINYSHPGYGNDSILRTLYRFFKEHNYSNPLVIIGISGLSRREIYSNANKRFYDHHIFDYTDDEEKNLPRLKARSAKLLGTEEKYKDLKTWLTLEQKYFFNLEMEEEKLEWKILFTQGFLKSKNIDSIFLNSISDHIPNIKNKINFLSFKQYDKEVFGKTDKPDTFYDFLSAHFYKEYGKGSWDRELTLRSDQPPYGKYFCSGHPSPGGNKMLFLAILKYIDENYS